MRLRLLLLTLTATLLLTGCGSSATVRVRTGSLSIALDEYRILPRSVSVPSGPVRITVVNHGILTHNLTLQLENRDSEGQTVTVASTHTIMPGATAVIAAKLRPGRYAMVSKIANQADLGMSGTLIVR